MVAGGRVETGQVTQQVWAEPGFDPKAIGSKANPFIASHLLECGAWRVRLGGTGKRQPAYCL
jgi:hypothetical protein